MPFPVVVLGWRAFRFEGNYVVCHETLRRLLPLGLPTEGEGSASKAELLENVGAGWRIRTPDLLITNLL